MDKNQGATKHFLAGLFFVVGLIVFGAVVFFIGLDRGLIQPKFQIITLFNEVSGLVEGAPIRISGVDVGVVGGIDFLDQPIEDRSLKVTLNIFKKYEFQFRKCARLSIKTEGVLGQKFIEISEDSKHKVFDVTKPIIGEDPLDVEDMAGVLTRTALSVQATSEDLHQVLDEWKYISRKTKRLINRFEDKLIEGNLFKIF